MSDVDMNISFAKNIGETAGKIWKCLDKTTDKSMTAIDMRKELLLSNSVFYTALGWLLREDKIVISSSEAENNFLIQLK